jgi:post-segregation antitoxin (ccd killing protein)
MPLTKRKVSVSLDEDLVEELEREEEGLSAQVNMAVRAELERRRRNRLLTELLAELDAKHGPVDDSLVEKYVGLLT